MRILLYLAIISLGAYIGFKELVPKKISGKVSSIQYVCLLFLLFVMGVKIGTNKEILRLFPKLGFTALIISIFSIIFSILGVKVISKYMNVSKEEKRA
ncbi:Membrane protein of unknown function [Caminicella sporogenes DSM 14501]|uniref:Lysine exporter LysO n=1 Tax=Caminicella sporogenes DSM 14501 TaxID=1121266 RepID=A0A1M6LQK0_9FIRM|nr:LysO family transporter [Caminicella sporogenes]RKD27912.1 hypothetical protein BET04_02295 [Caminicella sporogenes]SHJ73332.1 Membrane protein of unknown function [Caminicella sporogenes DSM 14501]